MDPQLVRFGSTRRHRGGATVVCGWKWAVAILAALTSGAGAGHAGADPRRDIDRDHGEQDQDQRDTLTTGSSVGRWMAARIHIGMVCVPAPAVKFVTMISSNDRAKASSAPGQQRRATSPAA